MRFALLFLVFIGLSGCAHPDPIPIESIYWSDGDSGRLTLETGEVIKFRLKDVDAPETGGVGSIGGAKCEAERVLGFEAKAFMVNLTHQPLVISQTFGLDGFDRLLVNLSVVTESARQNRSQPLADLAIDQGHLRPWDYDGGDPKPDWCGRSSQ